MQRGNGVNLDPYLPRQSQSPYGAKWVATKRRRRRMLAAVILGSQSPYGAKWVATALYVVLTSLAA